MYRNVSFCASTKSDKDSNDTAGDAIFAHLVEDLIGAFSSCRSDHRCNITYSPSSIAA